MQKKVLENAWYFSTRLLEVQRHNLNVESFAYKQVFCICLFFAPANISYRRRYFCPFFRLRPLYNQKISGESIFCQSDQRVRMDYIVRFTNYGHMMAILYGLALGMKSNFFCR